MADSGASWCAFHSFPLEIGQEGDSKGARAGTGPSPETPFTCLCYCWSLGFDEETTAHGPHVGGIGPYVESPIRVCASDVAWAWG